MMSAKGRLTGAAITIAVLVLPITACTAEKADQKVVATSGVPDNPAATADAQENTTSTSVSPAVEPAARIGATLEIDLGDTTALVTVADLVLATPSQFARFSGELYSVDVTMQSVEGEVSVNPMWFEARTEDGTVLRVELGGVDDQLAATSVLPGQKVRGFVSFDVPVGKPITEVVFTGPGTRQLGNWQA